MVAQDGVHAIPGLQTREDGDEGIEFGGKAVHQVAREDDEVGMQRVDDFHRPLHGFRVGVPTACVDVGQLHNAIAVKGFGEVFGTDFHFLHLEVLLALGGSEEDDATREEGDGQGEVALVELMVYLPGQGSEGHGKEGKECLGYIDAEEDDE